MNFRKLLFGLIMFTISLTISALASFLIPRYSLMVESRQPLGIALHVESVSMAKAGFVVLQTNTEGSASRLIVGWSEYLPKGIYTDLNILYDEDAQVSPGKTVFVTIYEDLGNQRPDIITPFDYPGLSTEVDEPVFGLGRKIYKKSVLIE